MSSSAGKKSGKHRTTNSSDDMSSISEKSGDSEPEHGDDVVSEARSASDIPNSEDNEFIDSADDVNDLSSDGSLTSVTINTQCRITHQLLRQQCTLGNELTRKRLFTTRQQNSPENNVAGDGAADLVSINHH